MQQQLQLQQEHSSSQPQPAAHSSTLHASVSRASETDDDSEEETGGFDVAELYAAVKPEGNETELTGDNPKLRPTLRPYQKRAAAWMVSRENASQVQSCVVHTRSWVWRLCLSQRISLYHNVHPLYCQPCWSHFCLHQCPYRQASTANPGIRMPSHMTAKPIHHLQDIYMLVLQHMYASTSQSCLQSKFHCSEYFYFCYFLIDSRI